MTNREIKFELAKIALMQNASFDFDKVKEMYEWVVSEPEEKTVKEKKPEYYGSSVGEIISYLENTERGKYPTILARLFESNNIETVGDLLEMGKNRFQKLNGAGRGSVSRVDDALYELYGIKNWYNTNGRIQV